MARRGRDLRRSRTGRSRSSPAPRTASAAPSRTICSTPAGASLAFDLPKTRLIQQFRGWARSSATIEGDVADEDVVREAVRFALDRFGRLDAVVANAGIFIRRPIRRLSLEDWRRVLDTNLTATFLLARAAQRPLRSPRARSSPSPRRGR